MSTEAGVPSCDRRWCFGDKDLIVTSLASSRIWATIGRGVINEVYWPSTGRAQLRQLTFMVASDDQWQDVSQLDSYEVTTPAAYILTPAICHRGGDFELRLEVACDSDRDAVLLRYRLTGEQKQLQLFALLTPRLGSPGAANAVRQLQGGIAVSAEGRHLHVRCNRGFARSSAVQVGKSGQLKFHPHSRATWEHEAAEGDDVAALAELANHEGTLALAFSETSHGAETFARASLAAGFDAIEGRAAAAWKEWRSKWKAPGNPAPELQWQLERTAAVLKACEDRQFAGAIVASPTIPWGGVSTDLAGYHLVWPRDSVEMGFSMIALDHFDEARQLAAYLIATQQQDGHWTQNFFPDGAPYWTCVQLDQTAFPIILAARLSEQGELGTLEGVEEMVRAAATFLLRTAPVTPEDRWEEIRGVSAFTLGITIAALVAAAELLTSDAQRQYLLSFADYLNARLEDWLYVRETALARKYGVDGYYVRLATPDIFSGNHGTVAVANQGGEIAASEMVSLDYAYLARLGLRRCDDPRMQNTLKVVEGELRVETPNGPSFYRYTGDAYGEHDGGAPFDGTGRGRLWPLLTGERGHLAVLQNEDAAYYLQAMSRMTGRGGMLPEQIWDGPPIPERRLYPGKPTGSAMPLLWAHAEFLTLAKAIADGTAVERLNCVVRRYGAQRPSATTWHWRRDAPFDEIPPQTDLLIEAPDPFALRTSGNSARHEERKTSEALECGMFGVRVDAEALASLGRFSFDIRSADEKAETHHSLRVAPR